MKAVNKRQSRGGQESEAILLKKVKAFLDLLSTERKLAYKRIHVMPVMRGGYGAMTFSTNPMKGMGDLQLYLPAGKMLEWELKTLSHKQTPAQLMRQEELERLGFEYRVIRSLDQAVYELAKHGITHYAYPVKDCVCGDAKGGRV